MASAPLLAVLTGPSGAGKDSLLAHLKGLGRPYHFATTVTTRPKRGEERDGIHYYFVSKDEFEKVLQRGDLLEHASVYGNFYGVPKGPIREALEAGKDVLLRTDVQGARSIKSTVPSATVIFVAPPSVDEQENRLRGRGEDPPEQVELRLKTAREEMKAAGEVAFKVVNDDLERCAREIEEILDQERERRDREPVAV